MAIVLVERTEVIFPEMQRMEVLSKTMKQAAVPTKRNLSRALAVILSAARQKQSLIRFDRVCFRDREVLRVWPRVLPGQARRFLR